MFCIAHRANINGPSLTENTWAAVQECFKQGYAVELDVHWDGRHFWLGHDLPGEETNLHQLSDSRIWCHAKSVSTFMELSRHKDIQSFFQESDGISLTSNGYYWCHTDKPASGSRSILTIPDIRALKTELLAPFYAICTDYPRLLSIQIPPAPKLIILDIDGVMTPGFKTYDRSGAVISKTFMDKDFTAIKRFLKAGVQVIFMSGDGVINSHIAKTRGIPFWCNQQSDRFLEKKDMLPEILKTYGVTKDETVFVGDDYYDLLLIEELEHTYCPSDAIGDVRERVKTVLPVNGGEGVIVALYDNLRDKIPNVYPVDSPEVNPQ